LSGPGALDKFIQPKPLKFSAKLFIPLRRRPQILICGGMRLFNLLRGISLNKQTMHVPGDDP